MSKYGQVGWDVGIVGRWFRLVMGGLMTSLFVFDFVGGSHTHSLRTNVLTGLFFVGFILVYFAAYLLVIEKVKDKSPWIPTMIFVFPAMYFLINGMIVPFELSFEYQGHEADVEQAPCVGLESWCAFTYRPATGLGLRQGSTLRCYR